MQTGMQANACVISLDSDMPRPRKYEDKAEGYAAQNARRKALRREHRVEFTAIEGEGVGSGCDHRYVLLGVGENQISDDKGLRFEQIAEFLYSRYQNKPSNAFVGFFLGYDFTQWLKTLPENRAWYLLSAEGIARRARTSSKRLPPFPVSYEGWEFDILGMKRFKLRPEGSKSWMYICDAGPFFQGSLMSVIDPKKWTEPVVTEDEYAILSEGKARRDHARLDRDMRRYNALENDVLARLMSRLNEGFTAAGIRLKKNQWFGPGQASQLWLNQQRGMPTGEELRKTYVHTSASSANGDGSATDVAKSVQRKHVPMRPDSTGSHGPGIDLSQLVDVLERGRLTYYGGWFEIFTHGHVPGNSFEYDINSAYPYIASQLPCLLHGQWTHGTGIPGKVGPDSIRIVHARVSGSNPSIGAMLHRRDDGSIVRPHQTAGWYWQRELDAATQTDLINTIEYLEWSEYVPCSCRPPLRGLQGLYEQRLQVGKDSPQGKAYKLVYNSLYGKLAQSVGNPKYGNSIYASLITSGCRSLILDAIATHPNRSHDVLMVATDGVYFRSPHPGLPISNRLGEWDVQVKENLTLFKPGVYWDDVARRQIRDGSAPSFKARGINAGEFGKMLASIDHHFSQWPELYPHERDPEAGREGWFPQVRLDTSFSMVTCQQAIHRRKWGDAGTLGHRPIPGICDGCSGAHLLQDSDPILKRHSGYYRDGVYWSRPYKDGGPGGLESTPYERRFGQPDPEEYGITPDGNVMDHWKGIFDGE